MAANGESQHDMDAPVLQGGLSGIHRQADGLTPDGIIVITLIPSDTPYVDNGMVCLRW